MSRMYRGTEIFQPLNTGWIDGHVACVREWVANIFFYRKDGTTIMIDAGYNYDRLAEKMAWLGIAPESIRHILITHQDTDHVGAVEEDSPGSPCARWPSWRRSCAHGGYAHSSLPATPAGRTVRLRLRAQGPALLA